MGDVDGGLGQFEMALTEADLTRSCRRGWFWPEVNTVDVLVATNQAE